MKRPTPILYARGVRVWMAMIGLACATSAQAGGPVAIVEAVDSPGAGVELMDTLEAGRTLRLGAGGTIEIGYLASCLDERITGGVVAIGSERSDVVGGVVDRSTVACDSGHIVTGPESQAFAGSVQRDAAGGAGRIERLPKQQLVLHGSSPLIVADGPGPVTVARYVDGRESQTLTLESAQGRSSYDFARFGRSLPAGGVYRARLGNREIVFRVDREAEPGPTPMLGRLLLFSAEP